MSILIKGRNMPENCQECVCLNDEYFYCQVVGRKPSDENIVNTRPDWCPLVEIPKHGRLIDADALKMDLTRFYDGEVTAKHLIDEQPTIIPADPEKEE